GARLGGINNGFIFGADYSSGTGTFKDVQGLAATSGGAVDLSHTHLGAFIGYMIDWLKIKKVINIEQ
ncbi:MAG: hypothetical protein ACE5HI_20710, partial [bacterium]